MMKGLVHIIIKIWRKFKSNFVFGLFITLFIVFASFANRSVKSQLYEQVNVNIQKAHSNDFLTSEEIYYMINSTEDGNVKGQKVEHIDLNKIEKKLRENSFIEKAEVYSDLKGQLYVDVIHRSPILRIRANNGNDYYLDNHCMIMPTSPTHTAKTLVATGFVRKSDFSDPEGSFLYQLALKIENNEFLRALIGQIYVDKDKNIMLFPKLGNIIIEFGNQDDMDSKINKLEILYKKILPSEGWNKYKRASLKYKYQIVLKKK